MLELYMRMAKYEDVVIVIDGTFVGVRGETFEYASRMYSGNTWDRGKLGYTLVTAFDSVSKLPLTAKVGIISEKNTAMEIVEMCLRWEKEGKIKIKAFVFDALYPCKELLNLIRKHGFVMRIPCHEWLLKEIDRGKSMGNKHVELWGHKVLLYWKNDEKRGGKYSLIITNLDEDPWMFYKHHKQAIENYHKDLKSYLNIRKLPSRRFYPICVYIMMIIIIYMLVWAVIRRYNLNRSCGFIFFIIRNSCSLDELMYAFMRMGES